ncbi:FadR/GntR family transcriptional regulator [Paenarthrobacter sp. YJN-5]|uniref:FadR/GntR family transcriptional regulator n=1 Tax=Paenarthrobacter sp. YJN-5 TaxID=2735316 RepID=UPI001878782A|nr:FCD domain-containing protein [Paenarthrobacter sp. YJN-5]QOT19845.1 FadR family transcriptional regulator [Paenarthrobacter sp. YJN-5]
MPSWVQLGTSEDAVLDLIAASAANSSLDTMAALPSSRGLAGGSVDRAEFAAIVQPRAHDFVVEQIRRQIALGIIRPGAALPPERELMKLFGVGRATIQSAIGKLETEHVVETRRGRAGGSFVKAPTSDAPSLDFRVVELRRQAGSILDAVEFREVLEPLAAAVATTKAKRTQLRTLEELCEKTSQASDDAEFMRWDTAFHLAVGEATSNRFLCNSLEAIRLELNPALQLLPDTRVWHDLSNDEHRQIVDAIKSKDAEKARHAMAAHISHPNQSIRSLIKSLSMRSDYPFTQSAT